MVDALSPPTVVPEAENSASSEWSAQAEAFTPDRLQNSTFQQVAGVNNSNTILSRPYLVPNDTNVPTMPSCNTQVVSLNTQFPLPLPLTGVFDVCLPVGAGLQRYSAANLMADEIAHELPFDELLDVNTTGGKPGPTRDA